MSDERQSLLSSPTSSVSTPTYPPYADAGDRFAVSGTQRPKWKTRSAFMLILGTETLERTAFYGLICNMLIFLNSNPLGWMSYNASIVILVLSGLSYVTAVVGGWFADSYLGKFRSIAIFFFIYVAGYVFWPLLSPYPNAPMTDNLTAPAWCSVNQSYVQNDTGIADFRQIYQENCWWPVFISIVVIAIGYGTVRVNLIPFGAVQVEHEGQHAMRTYFNWFYWCINVGSLLAYGILGYVQQEKSYFWGYVTPNIVLVCSFIVFISGSCLYIKKPATGSPINTVVRVCREACRLWRYQRRQRDAEIFISDATGHPCSCLDYAKVRHGGSFPESAVDEIKVLGKVMVVFITLIPYWVVYFQMQTTFIWQALHMQLDFDENNTKEAAHERPFNIPPAWLSLFNVVFILLLLPLLDKLIYPLLDRSGYSPSLRIRMLIGMVFSLLSMVVAGLVENKRMDTFWDNGTTPDIHWQRIGHADYQAARMSVLFQLPQYALVGIGELFTSIAGLELAYIYAPRSMQGIIMSLFWFSEGLGALVGVAFVFAFEGTWFTSYDHGNINCSSLKTKDNCHLDYFFFFVGGVQVLGMFSFALAAWGLNIGQTVPIRIQRQGYTMVRAQDDDAEVTDPPRARDQASVNRVRSGSS